jgi:ligand-binding sensor domain-containing protein/signal transduction histidine kinase
MINRLLGAGQFRRPGLVRVALLVGLLGPGIVLAAQPHYAIRGWQTEEGLPGSSVNAIIQDRDGYLWLGTYAGLARFDGVRFTVYDSDTTPELKTSRITSLYEDLSGTLWVGHETGELTRLRAGHFQPVEVPPRWTGGKTVLICADEERAIWLLNKEALLTRVKDGRVISPKESPGGGSRVFMMTQDRRGKVWIAHHGALGVLERGQFVPCLLDEPAATGYVQAVCASRDGGVWILSSGRLRRWRDGRWNADLGTGPWGLFAVTALVETRRGDVAVGTSDQGLYLVTPDGPPQHFDRATGLGSDWVRCICEDREGNLWLGVGNSGLKALRPAAFEQFDPPDHWKGCAVLAVTLGRDGSLWLGTEGAGLYHLQAGQWTAFAETEGLTSRFVWSVAEDAEGRLWVGTWSGGLFVRQGSHLTVAPSLEGVNPPMTALLQGRRGELWVGTGSGLLRYQANQATWFGSTNGLALPDVRTVIETADGAIWFGMSGGGLGCLKDGKLKTYDARDGLASNFVLCLRSEPDGTLWIGTFGGGLARFKLGHFAKISTHEGLANNVIQHIEEDEHGDFWMSSQRGILRVSKRALEQCADGQTNRVPCTAYGIGDGMETTECSGGFQPAGCKTPDGRLWFPTRKGLVAVNPSNIRTNPLPPPVIIEELLVDGVATNVGGLTAARASGDSVGDGASETAAARPAEAQASSPRAEPLRIPPGRQRFEFRFTALSLTAPEKAQFKYRLQGLETAWVDAGAKRSASYSYLPPGDYDFRVMACNNDQVWNEQGASLAFAVLPHFWQSWWFRTVAYLGGVAGVGGTVLLESRRRHRRKLAHLEHARALERERARIARDIHDDLGASLTRITMLSQSTRKSLDQPQQAAAHLEVIYRTARALTLAMDEIVWAVNPKHDTLDSLVTYLVRFAQDYLGPADIRCRLDLPVQLPAWPLTTDVRHNLFLAFKEALHNVVKHASASEVVVSLKLEPSSFLLSVGDNGCGFVHGAANPAHSPASDRPAAGNGLENMRRRLEDVGGACCLESVLGKGTTVNFRVRRKARDSSLMEAAR